MSDIVTISVDLTPISLGTLHITNVKFYIFSDGESPTGRAICPLPFARFLLRLMASDFDDASQHRSLLHVLLIKTDAHLSFVLIIRSFNDHIEP